MTNTGNSLGISFVSAYGRTSGNFAGDRGSWLLSARRGFLDVLTERVVADDEQLTPRYTDVFGAVTFDVGERSSLAARLLMSDDDLQFTTDGGDDIDSAGTGRSAHLWFEFDHGWTDTLQMDTLLSISTVNQTARRGRHRRHPQRRRAQRQRLSFPRSETGLVLATG